MPVRVEALDSEEVFTGSCRNISASGILLAIEERLNPRKFYDLLFSFEGVKVPINARALLVRAKEEYDKSGEVSSYLSAFQFHSMVPSLAQDLEEAIREMAMNTMEFLADYEPFDEIDENALLEIAGSLRMVVLQEGTQLGGDWDLEASLILLRSGLVKLSRPGYRPGREVALFGIPGCVIGEESLVTGRQHGFRIKALKRSELLVLGPRSYEYLVQEQPEAAELLKLVCRKIMEKRRKLGQKSQWPFGLVPSKLGG